MELWLLVGAVVLIALTVWIVWPAQRSEESTPMTDSSLPPQGDAFQDQYTSATADLSAGGVATTRETSAPVTMGATMPETAAGSEPWASPAVAREGIDQGLMPSERQRGMGLSRPRTMGTGAALLLMASSGIGGAWLYQRWQHERNRPINRLRRGARDLASRLPEFDELPENTAPVSGAAAALLVSSLILTRARRRPEPQQEATRDVIWGVVEESRQRARRLPRPELRRPELRRPELRRPELRRPERRETILGGLGVGGTAAVVGAGWLVWRLLKGNNQGPRHLYITDRMGE